MKVTNNVLRNLELTRNIQEAPKESDKVPETLAPAPDLNPTGEAQAQNKEDQAAKSESAELSSAAQDALIRGALEQKYIKGKRGYEASQSTGKQLSDSEGRIAEEATGNPMETITDRRGNNTQDSRSKYETPNEEVTNKGKELGSVYGDWSSGGGMPSGVGGVGSEAGRGGGTSGSEAGGGGGGIASGSGMTPEKRREFENAAGYNQGPASAKSKIDELKSRIPQNGFEQRDATVNKAFDNINPFNRVQDPSDQKSSSDSDPRSQHQRAKKYGGTEMISQSLGVDITMQELEDLKKKNDDKANQPAPKPEKTEQSFTEKAKDVAVKAKDFAVNFVINASFPARGVVLPPIPPDPQTGKDMLDAAQAIGNSKNRTPASETKKASESTTNSDGTKTTDNPKDTEQDELSRGKKGKAKLDSLIGMDLAETPKAPKTSGDVDPAEEGGTDIDRNRKPGWKSTDMISQPGDEGTGDLGASGGVSRGGDVDFEDKPGWSGREMREDPADVMEGSSPYNDQPLPPAANQQTEESTEESNSSLAAQLVKNLRLANLMRTK